LKELEGKTVIITGAGSGIGLACAEGFLADGARVLGVDNQSERLQALAAKGALTMTADVAEDASIRAMINKAVAETGRVDVLFNNAGMGSRTRIEDFKDGEFERMMAVHVFGAVYAMRAAIPHMRRQKYGRIISTISRGAEATWGAAYAAAKAALWAVTRCLAQETADENILVNALIPGPTNTRIFGRDMPHLQPPEDVYPTVRMMAAFPEGGPSGKVFFWEREYPLFLKTIPEGSSLEYWEERGRNMTIR
jgi:NAD(P)-dependent dehydrogenase (short-subunit alcohol dehydrogenase family)